MAHARTLSPLGLLLALGLASACGGGDGAGSPAPILDAPASDAAVPLAAEEAGETLSCLELCERARDAFCQIPEEVSCETACARFESACPEALPEVLDCAGTDPTFFCIGGFSVVGCEEESRAFERCAAQQLYLCEERPAAYERDESTTRFPVMYAACAGEGYPASECAEEKGGDLLVDRVQQGGITTDVGAYLAFFFGDTFRAEDVRSVVLELPVAGQYGAPSVRAGDLWVVDPFNADTLEIAVPALRGDEPLVASPGAAESCGYVRYEIPVEYVTPLSFLYLAILPGEGREALDAAIYSGMGGDDAQPLLYVAR